ncbi:MAG TPA: lipid-A-disaccharide synthase [Pseudolabrys sp.]|nr:lipid-A-disaccharide synthase [Pseudolabrys sp.]
MNSHGRELHVFLVAGEESGDRLGAALMGALRALAPGVRFSGVGGHQMEAQGLSRAVTQTPSAIIGFAAIPARIVEYLRLIRQTADAAIAAKPDMLVIIDSPEFTHRVAKHVRRMAPDIPIINYGAPSVWAWRPGRARAMRGYVDHVMALLPFEPDAFKRLDGPPCSFVGHPATEHIGDLRPSAEDAQRRVASPARVVVMPGSRRGEISRLLQLFRTAVEGIATQRSDVEFVMPAVPSLSDLLKRETAIWRAKVSVVTGTQERNAAFRTARLALVKSGTSTLEVALAGVPMVATYRISHIEAVVAHFVLKVPSVILVNLVLGENIVPELLQYQSTPGNLIAAAMPLLNDGSERRRQVDAFRRLDDIMQIGGEPPSMKAAKIVLQYASR